MRKLLLAIPLLASALLAAPDDLILSQAKNPGPGNIQRNVAPTAFGFLTFDTNKVPTSPSDLLYSSGSLSIGESTNSAYRLYIRHTADLTKTRAINVEFNPTLVANNATSFRGLAVSQTINTAGFDATGTSYALNMGIGVNGSGGTASDLQGIRGSVRNDTSAAVTQAIGVSSGLFVNSSANMTTGYNFYGDATSGSSGLIPTYYGAYIASPAAGFGATLAAAYSAPWNSAANRYGLYFPGTVAHYLGGNLGVADGFTLSSAGSIDFTAGGTDENIVLTPGTIGDVRIPLAGGHLKIGTSTSDDPVVGSGFVNVQSGDSATIQQDAYISTASAGTFMVMRRARGTSGSPSAIQSDDVIFSFSGRAYGATGFSSSSRVDINFYAAENWTDAAQGTYIRFRTTPTGSTSPAEVSRLSAAGAWRWNAYGAGTLTTDGSGNITAVSDGRLKNIEGDYTTGLSAILGIHPKLFRWKQESGLDSSDLNAGFIAQDVLEAGLTEAVNIDRTVESQGANGEVTKERKPLDFYTLNDRAIIAALVNAVKELKAENDALSARVSALEGN